MSENTEELEARIAAYIDGQLPPAEAARLEVFLANTDPRLAEQIIGMLNDRHRLRTLPRPAAPVDLAGRIMEQVERATLLNDAQAPDHHAPHRWWQSKAAIAAALLLMIGGFSYFVTVAVTGGGGSQPRQIATGGNAGKTPPVLPAPVTSLPTEPPADAPRLEDRRLSKAGDRDAERALESLPPASRNAEDIPAAIASGRVSGGMGGTGAGGDHAGFAMKTSDSDLRVPGDKDIEKAEKVEQVISEQLVRNREVVQNGQPVASKLGYANVESPLRALANIAASSSPSSPDPVVVTLVARDDRDFARLRLALEDILNQDPAAAVAQTALHNKYRYNITNIDRRNALTNNGDSAMNSQAQRQLADAMKPSAGGTVNTTTNSTSSNTSGNADGYQFWDPANRGFEATPGGAMLARADNNTSPTNAAPAENAGNGAVALKAEVAKNKATASNGQAAPVPAAPGAPATQPQAASMAQQTDNNAGLQRRQQTLQNFDAGPLYRVALRQEQLVQLANQFRVDSITCGRQSYRITPDNYDYQLARAKDEKADDAEKRQKSVVRGSAKKAADEPLGPVAAGPPAPAASGAPAASPAPTAAASQNQEAEQKASSTLAGASQQTQAKPQNAPAFKSAAWIECIITMEQPPAHTTRPSSTESAPAQPFTR
jgi:hypothetical protein